MTNPNPVGFYVDPEAVIHRNLQKRFGNPLLKAAVERVPIFGIRSGTVGGIRAVFRRTIDFNQRRLLTIKKLYE